MSIIFLDYSSSSNVLYANGKFDITQEVLTELNARYELEQKKKKK